MSLEVILFYVFSGIAVLGALYIFVTNNVLHGLVSLLSVFLAVAGIFGLSGAEFVAITQIVVYVGGVLLILMFGVMLSSRVNLNHEITTTSFAYFYGVIILLGTSIGLTLILLMDKTPLHQGESVLVGVEDIGKSLMTSFVFPFELVAFVLLVSLVAAMHIAARKDVQE